MAVFLYKGPDKQQSYSLTFCILLAFLSWLIYILVSLGTISLSVVCGRGSSVRVDPFCKVVFLWMCYMYKGPVL